LAAGVIAAVALALRVLTIIGYFPANLSHPDTGSYVWAAAGHLFSDPFRPAGYPLFLRVLHHLSRDLQFTIVVQHAVGLCMAVGAYLVCRRTGARAGVALVAAAVVAWSGDQLLFEHALLSDGLFLAVLVLACYLALRLLDSADLMSPRQITLVVAASATVGALGTVRTVGAVLVPVFVVWLAIVAGPGWRRRLMVAAIGAITCLVPLLVYAVAQQQETGVFGISRFGAWPLYARVAPFANCSDFTPPARTAALCESSPAGSRAGPEFYLWSPRSPARRRFGFPPAHEAAVGDFALAAIEHQPLNYLYAVGRDLARYVDPHLVTGQGWLGADSLLTLNRRWPAGEADNATIVDAYWSDTQTHVRQRLMNFLEGWRQVFRIHGVVIALCALLSLLGIGAAPDTRTRRALGLLGAFSAVLFVVPVAVNEYSARYGVPAAVLLLVSGVRGAEIVAARVTRRWPHRAPPATLTSS
jgi:hypothetical protein